MYVNIYVNLYDLLILLRDYLDFPFYLNESDLGPSCVDCLIELA